MNTLKYFNTISNDLIYAIIGKDEYLLGYNREWYDKEGVCLIAIHNPGVNEHPSFMVKGFDDVLQVHFWDTEYDSESTPLITKDTATNIKDFINKNKDKRFMLHCSAGISRSAGVGMAVECIINNNGNVYEYLTSNSGVKEHIRYHPNRAVFDMIVKD